MANRTSKGLSTAQYLRELERRVKKLRIKKILCSDPFEARMLSGEIMKTQHNIMLLNRITCRHRPGGYETAALM